MFARSLYACLLARLISLFACSSYFPFCLLVLLAHLRVPSFARVLACCVVLVCLLVCLDPWPQFLTFELVRDRIFLEIPAAQEAIFYALVVRTLGYIYCTFERLG